MCHRLNFFSDHYVSEMLRYYSQAGLASTADKNIITLWPSIVSMRTVRLATYVPVSILVAVVGDYEALPSRAAKQASQ